MATVADIIERFGGAAKMAPLIGTPANTIRQWSVRGSIPGRCWQAIVTAAECVGVGDVTFEVLAQIAKARSAAESPAHPAAPGASAAGETG